jgi:hypothetical protein
MRLAMEKVCARRRPRYVGCARRIASEEIRRRRRKPRGGDVVRQTAEVAGHAVARLAFLQLRHLVLQRGNWAIGQRVWKWQPDGGRIGLGTSPWSGMRLRLTCGSGIGTADSSASV